MEEQETTLEKLSNSALSKIKLPIVSTYVIVLIVYNWQILLYLIFKNEAIDLKIDYIVCKNRGEYFFNILIPVLIALMYTLFFPILQVGINVLFNYFKKMDKKILKTEELDDAIHRFELQQNLTGKQSLERLQANIELLTTENQKLILDNKTLLERVKDVNQRDENTNIFRDTINKKKEKELNEISKSLLSKFNEFTFEEKSVFLDLINFFDKKDKFLLKNEISNISIHENFIEQPLNVLLENSILNLYYYSGGDKYAPSVIGFEVLEYFKNNFSNKL
ncbi:hypothetical protein QWY99_00585 [Flavobacterium branchiarum]|uniref:Uncharacterized protein n=1 Tax=Flavobacterium branchiarum TaxID=1114870 RepID=A0ABV5FR99_9FLAO|nr:hypothetical protein [Flavobacterium branchiarum]MDN3671561.1 hypothetical protein [Flavobacterium branchiarum]